MTHYERAAKYVTKRLGKRFTKEHIESLEKQFKAVAEDCAKIADKHIPIYVPTSECGEACGITIAEIIRSKEVK